MKNDILDPPAAYGQPVFDAVLKKAPEDFQVFENLSIAFSGEGEHLYLQVEKTAMNTDEVVACLQACYEVSSADIGFSGLKDRHSISTQWFSVRTPADKSLFMQTIANFRKQQLQWEEAGGYLKSMRVLTSERHSRKLKRGAHQSNNFLITLQQVQNLDLERADLKAEVDKRVRLVREQGFPNYIGSQRFGQNGQNLQRARQWFGKPRKRTSRQQRSLWLSAARSALFNTVCAARVRAGTWTKLLEGEPAALDGSGSFFVTGVGADDTAVQLERSSLEQRLRDFDIHPSAPWWGRGKTAAQGECADFEAVQMQDYGDLCQGLEHAGLQQERRAIRAIASGLEINWIDDSSVTLAFSLQPGVFATMLLKEFCTWTEPSRGLTADKTVGNEPT